MTCGTARTQADLDKAAQFFAQLTGEMAREDMLAAALSAFKSAPRASDNVVVGA